MLNIFKNILLLIILSLTGVSQCQSGEHSTHSPGQTRRTPEAETYSTWDQFSQKYTLTRAEEKIAQKVREALELREKGRIDSAWMALMDCSGTLISDLLAYYQSLDNSRNPENPIPDPDSSMFYPWFMFRKAVADFQENNFSQAITRLEQLQRQSHPYVPEDSLQYILALAYEKTDSASKSNSLLYAIATRQTPSAFIETSAKRIKLNDQDLWFNVLHHRFQSFISQKNLLKAKKILADMRPLAKSTEDKALYRYCSAELKYKKKQQRAAIQEWTEIIKKEPKTRIAEKTREKLFQIARQAKNEKLMESYLQNANYPQEKLKFHLKLADYYLSRDDIATAQNHLAPFREIEARPWPDAFTQIFRHAVTLFYRENLKTAAEYLALSDCFKSTPFEAQQVLFFNGLIREKLKDTTAAKSFFQQAAALIPGSFYGLESQGKCQIDTIARMKPFVWEKKPNQLVLVKKIMFYYHAGLDDLASRHAQYFLETNKSVFSAWLLTNLHRENKRYYHSANTARLYLMDSLYRYGLQTDRELLALIFPQPLQSQLDRIIIDTPLSQALVYSIINSESRFNHEAVSVANARGLMQLMPTTAKSLAKKKKLTYHISKLFDAEYNITLGTVYLNDLLNRHQPFIAPGIASYNAGPNAVKRWLENRPYKDLYSFIELIPYRETRYYTKTVWRDYYFYRLLSKE